VDDAQERRVRLLLLGEELSLTSSFLSVAKNVSATA
jgi:hypothetical protein